MKLYRYIILCLVALTAMGSVSAEELPLRSDSSVQPDARYKLIKESYTINNDGTSDYQYRKEITLYRNRAITAYADKGETFILYNPAFETLTINECYTVMADGTKVVTPKAAFVDQLPSEAARCGRFNGLREMAIVHTALEPNSTIVLDYTIHRKGVFFNAKINMQKDCPVDRYELKISYPSSIKASVGYANPTKGDRVGANGLTAVRTDIPEAWNEPYLPEESSYTFYFYYMPDFKYTKTVIPEAKQLVEDLQEDNNQTQYAENICHWVMDNVNENDVPYERLNFQYATGRETFNSNCGTLMDKAILMADMLQMAGFDATVCDPMTLVKESLDKPFKYAVVYKVDGEEHEFMLRPIHDKMVMRTVYVTTTLPFEAIPLIGNPSPIYKFVVPNPKSSNIYTMDPAKLTSVRKAPLAVEQIRETEHYTVYLPREMDLIKPINYKRKVKGVGEMQVSVTQKGKTMTIDRVLTIKEATVIDPITQQSQYQQFRTMLNEWNSSKQFYIKRHNK